MLRRLVPGGAAVDGRAAHLRAVTVASCAMRFVMCNTAVVNSSQADGGRGAYLLPASGVPPPPDAPEVPHDHHRPAREPHLHAAGPVLHGPGHLRAGAVARLRGDVVLRR